MSNSGVEAGCNTPLDRPVVVVANASPTAARTQPAGHTSVTDDRIGVLPAPATSFPAHATADLKPSCANATFKRVCLLGMPFDALTETEALGRILDAARRADLPRLVTTINVAILMMARRDARLSEACRSSEMILADGQPLVWVSRLLKSPLPERVAGCTLMERLLEEADRQRLRVYFLGATDQVATTLVERTRRQWPGVVVAGYRNGYFTPEEDEAVARQVGQARPHLVFIGLPSPRKELFAYHHLDTFGPAVVVPVGGSFDVLAGIIRRAPRWMQRCGLEWFWRLIMEPRKLFWRYLSTNSRFIAIVLAEFVRQAACRLLPRRERNCCCTTSR